MMQITRFIKTISFFYKNYLTPEDDTDVSKA